MCKTKIWTNANGDEYLTILAAFSTEGRKLTHICLRTKTSFGVLHCPYLLFLQAGHVPTNGPQAGQFGVLAYHPFYQLPKRQKEGVPVLRIAFQSVPVHQKQKHFRGATEKKYILQMMVFRVFISTWGRTCYFNFEGWRYHVPPKRRCLETYMVSKLTKLLSEQLPPWNPDNLQATIHYQKLPNNARSGS